MLLNRRVVVGICGGIASYKAIDLVSKLQQAGAQVDVIMTEKAEEFIRPLTFATMSHRTVYTDLWEPSGQAAETHIALAVAAELLVIVPATANTIAKIAHGMADNMLTAVALATRAPLLLAPAMHTNMYTHPATQANLNLLRERGAIVVEPEHGRLASGEIGQGRLPDTPHLIGAIQMVLGRPGDLAGRCVIVTAGGTHEPIDPVRYIGNRSSGKMGYAIAEEARDRGARVIVITGPVTLPTPYGVEVHQVETAVEMRDLVQHLITEADVIVMSAAVADFRPATAATHKIKKQRSQGGNSYDDDGGFSLRLVPNPDILRELAEAEGTLKERPVSSKDQAQETQRLIRVGFAAETEDLIRHAQAKLEQKQLDLLIANDVTRSDSGFGTDTNKVLIFHADGAIEDLPVMPKFGVAKALWDRVVPLFGTR